MSQTELLCRRNQDIHVEAYELIVGVFKSVHIRETPAGSVLLQMSRETSPRCSLECLFNSVIWVREYTGDALTDERC